MLDIGLKSSFAGFEYKNTTSPIQMLNYYYEGGHLENISVGA